MGTRHITHRGFGPIDVFGRLFSLSGLFLYFVSLGLLIQHPPHLDLFKVPFLQGDLKALLLFVQVVCVIHFVYGIRWLQQVDLMKAYHSGGYYFFRRFVFVGAFIYLLAPPLQVFLSQLGSMPDEALFLGLHDLLFVFFVVHASLALEAFMVKTGFLMHQEGRVVFRFVFVFLPFVIALYQFSQNIVPYIQGVLS